MGDLELIGAECGVGGGEVEQNDVGSQSIGDWLPGIGGGRSLGLRKQSVWRDGVDNGLKPIAFVRTQK